MHYFKPLMIAAILSFALPAAAIAAPGDADYELGQAAADEYRYAEALAHFEKAAEQGNEKAQHIAGMMRLYGERLYGPEVRRDRNEALRQLRAASATGDETSAYMVRHMGRQIGMNDAAAVAGRK